MNKQDFVVAVAAKAKVSQKEAGDVVNAVLDVIIASLKKGEEVNITGFGKFESKKAPATVKKNPATGQPVKVAACLKPKFKAGKGLKDSLNGKK